MDDVERAMDLEEIAKRGAASALAERQQAPSSGVEALAHVTGAQCVKLPAPERVLWLAAGAQPVIVSVGEPAIFAAPGGSGKSFAALALMLAASSNEKAALGFGVRPGPALYVSYEDSEARVGARLKAIRAETGLDRLLVVPDALPLFRPDESRNGAIPEPAFMGLRELVDQVQPTLVVVDPVSAAAGAVGLNDAAGARAIMRAFAGLSADTGAGVLVIAHDTKAARALAKSGESPGAGAVSGSGQWHDAARAVLYMHKTDSGREIECVKANHGRDGWAQPIAEVVDGTGNEETFHGFKVDGEPWWDYESIRRQRQQDRRITEKRADQEARDAAKAERHPDDVGNGRNAHGIAM